MGVGGGDGDGDGVFPPLPVRDGAFGDPSLASSTTLSVCLSVCVCVCVCETAPLLPLVRL